MTAQPMSEPFDLEREVKMSLPCICDRTPGRWNDHEPWCPVHFRDDALNLARRAVKAEREWTLEEIEKLRRVSGWKVELIEAIRRRAAGLDEGGSDDAE